MDRTQSAFPLVSVVMVVDDAQVEDVLFGRDGALETLAPGSTVVLCSTVPVAGSIFSMRFSAIW